MHRSLKQVGDGFDNIDDFLKTVSISEFKLDKVKRKEIALKLDKLQATQRASAKALGVSHTSIQRDVGTNVPKKKKDINDSNDLKDDIGTNVPTEPKWADTTGDKIAAM